MPTLENDGAKLSKKPGIPRPSGIRQSLGHISKSSVSKVITEVMHGSNNSTNKENAKAKESRRLSALKPPSTITITKENKDTDSGSESKASVGVKPVKSPLVVTVVAKPTQPVASATRTANSTPSPTSTRKQTVLSTSTTTVASAASISTLKPREGTGTTSLPKYKPKSSLLPPKQITLTRKRRSSIVEAEDEDSPNPPGDEAVGLAERPISPLPRRRSRVQSTVSISSKQFDPKVTLNSTPEKSPVKSSGESIRTPVRTRASDSTPSSVRVRTVSTATTTSSRLSGKNMESPMRRTEKRPRLSSSETKSSVDHNKLGSSLLSMSTSTIGVGDVSSDSIEIADVSALLSVSPNVSPAKSTAPSSIRRVPIRKPPGLPTINGGSPSPSRKAGTSTLPTRQSTAATYLEPPKPQSSMRRPPLRNAGNKNRKSIVSWGEFTKKSHLFQDDLGLIADMTPLKGIVTPGSEDLPLRQRVDSGWGLDSPRVFGSRFNAKSPSIGQLMFPSTDGAGEKTARSANGQKEPLGAPHSEDITNRLLSLKAAEAEREVEALKQRVKALEGQLQSRPDAAPVPFPSDDEPATVPAPEASGTDISAAVENELALQRLQNAELDAKAAFLEHSLTGALEQIAERDGKLEEMTEAMRRLETRFEREKDELEEENRLAAETAKETVELAQRQVKEVGMKYEGELKVTLAVHETIDAWGLARLVAQSDLESVRQMQLTIGVFKMGLEAIRSKLVDNR